MPLYSLKCAKCSKIDDYIRDRAEIETSACKFCNEIALSINWADNAPSMFIWGKGNFSASSTPKEKIVKAMAETFKVTKDVSDYKPVQEKNDEKFVGKYVDVD